MHPTVGAVRTTVIGARTQPPSTHGLSRESTRAPMSARPVRPIVGCVCRPTRWILPFFAVVLAVLVVTSALSVDPTPALHGKGLFVLAGLVGYVGLLAFGIVYRTRHVDPVL